MGSSSMVVRETGEIIDAAPFDFVDYLSRLHSPAALATQNRLAAAYDAACASLIGPGDVQIERGRKFKKKSAWRKLARAFRVSVAIPEDRITTQVLEGGHFLATVVARAEAPWGQTFEDVASCCTDEATGRRTISKADCIATAATRAANRAISNLIAMGEVSAEEVKERPTSTSMPEAEPAERAPIAAETPCPYDPHKRPLGELRPNQLAWLREQLAAKVDEGDDEQAEAWLSAVSQLLKSPAPRRAQD